MPLNISAEFLDEFFTYGWSFFYRFTLTFLKSLQTHLLQIDESDNHEMLKILKEPQKQQSATDSASAALDLSSRESEKSS